MEKVLLSILLVFIIGLSVALLVPQSSLAPDTNPAGTTAASNSGSLDLRISSNWKGVESMVTPLDEYVKSTSNAKSGVYFSEFIWPLADVDNPFKFVVNKGSGVAIVTVLSVEKVYRHDIHAYVVYKARIDKVIVEPQNTVKLPSEAACIKSPTLCDTAKKQQETVNNLISKINQDNIINLIIPAFITKEAVNKTNLTLADVATPFPLLEPGHKYIVFLDAKPDGIHVHYDLVWGPWAYLIADGKVYSLNHVKPSSNASLDPSRLLKSPYIHWQPYSYDQLRKIALEKLGANGESLEDFVSRITEG